MKKPRITEGQEKIRRVFDEWHFKGCPRTSFVEGNLPDPSKIAPMPTVTLMRDKMNEFRDRYLMLLKFVAFILDKEDFNIFDLQEYAAMRGRKGK